jgi:hypothetical protein
MFIMLVWPQVAVVAGFTFAFLRRRALERAQEEAILEAGVDVVSLGRLPVWQRYAAGGKLGSGKAPLPNSRYSEPLSRPSLDA